jgi:hypothetical protein
MANLPPILDTADYRHRVLDGVNSIETSLADLQGFQIPEYDELALTYYGSTNNIATVVYKKDSSASLSPTSPLLSFKQHSQEYKLIMKTVINKKH